MGWLEVLLDDIQEGENVFLLTRTKPLSDDDESYVYMLDICILGMGEEVY